MEEKNSSSKKDSLRNCSSIASFIKSTIYLLLLVAFLRGTVIEAFRIPSESMVPTLIEYDHILVTKFNYGLRAIFFPLTLVQFSVPNRNDIVVFTREDEPNTNIIKRVIGLPGETIEIKGQEVLINGKVIEEPKNVKWLEGGLVSFGPVKIPEGHVFMMGDNRDHSKDSRFWDNPFLDVRRIKGRAQLVYFNWTNLSRIGTLIR